MKKTQTKTTTTKLAPKAKGATRKGPTAPKAKKSTESMNVGSCPAPKTKIAKVPSSAKKTAAKATPARKPKWDAAAREAARERMTAYWNARAEATLANAKARALTPSKPSKVARPRKAT